MRMKKLLLLFVAMLTVLSISAKTSDESEENLVGTFEPVDGNYDNIVTGSQKVVQLTLINEGKETVAAHEINLYLQNPQDDNDFFYIGSGTYNCPAIEPGDTVKAQWTMTFSKEGTYYLVAYDNLTENSYESNYFTVTASQQEDHADTTFIIRPVDGIWGCVENQDKQMEVIVKNSGVGKDINLSSFFVGWDCNEDYNVYGFSSYFAGGTLAPGDSVKYTFVYTPTQSGTYYFYVSDYYNSFDIGVIHKFHVYANDKELQDAIDAGKADGPDEYEPVKIEANVYPTDEQYENLKVGTPKDFTVQLFNKGTTPVASHPLYPTIINAENKNEYKELEDFTVPEISAGDSVAVNFTVTPTEGGKFYLQLYDNLTKQYYNSYTFTVKDTYSVVKPDTLITLTPDDGFAGAVAGVEKSMTITIKNMGINSIIKSFTIWFGVGNNDTDDYDYPFYFTTGKLKPGESVEKRFTFTPKWGAGDYYLWLYLDKSSSKDYKDFYTSFPIYATQEEYDSAVAAGVKGITTVKDKANKWYTMSGSQLEGKPTQPGLYINGNRKVVIK